VSSAKGNGVFSPVLSGSALINQGTILSAAKGVASVELNGAPLLFVVPVGPAALLASSLFVPVGPAALLASSLFVPVGPTALLASFLR
jgi:hypothetical protein